MLKLLKKFTLLSALQILLWGCVESSFNLASESRLPKWFDIPEGTVRSDFELTMDYYVKPSGRTAIFNLYDKKGNRLKTVQGVQRGLMPIRLEKFSENVDRTYPGYEVITVDGVTDVIEHRKMEPVFYLTDDPDVLKELQVSQ